MLISRVPAAPLSAFVSVLWYADGWKPLHPRERLMPSGSAGLIISLQDDRRAGAIVSGPRSESFVMRIADAPQTMIGAQFTHGGAAAFFDMPLCALRNTHAALEDVAGASSARLRERLLDRPAAGERLEFLAAWLRDRMLRRSEPDRAILWAIGQLRQPQTRVADVSKRIGRSSRWFIDRFASVVGLTPKVFSRVQRFQAALRQVHEQKSVRLADLAVSCGYYDEAHLIHEFSSLAGMSPSALLAARTEYLNHLVERG
jgi:AraC-like DNA-binding protein